MELSEAFSCSALHCSNQPEGMVPSSLPFSLAAAESGFFEQLGKTFHCRSYRIGLGCCPSDAPQTGAQQVIPGVGVLPPSVV
jgi:hypothetical protein